MAPSRAMLNTLSSLKNKTLSSTSTICQCRRAYLAVSRSSSLTSSSWSSHCPRAGVRSRSVTSWKAHEISARPQRYNSTTTASAQTVEPPDFLDEQEKAIFLQLREALQPTELEVQDVSGGCGSMYAVAVTSERFKGLPMIKQHRLVNEILKEKIKDWHGLQLKTKST